MIFVFLILLIVHCAKYHWKIWTFEEDGIEIRKLEVYNRHSGKGGNGNLWSMSDVNAEFTVSLNKAW